MDLGGTAGRAGHVMEPASGTGVATPANLAVNSPHSAVTARAYRSTRRAVGRAGYRARWADMRTP